MERWVKIYPRIINWCWYSDADTFRVFFHLLMTASYNEHNNRGVELKPGQVVVGRKKLAAELGISEQRVRTAIAHLKSTNEITTKPTNKFTLVTIAKWAFYQQNVEQINQQINQQSNQQSTTTKNNIEIYKEKDISNDISQKQIAKATPKAKCFDSVVDAELKEALTEFVKMRKLIKKPMTDEAIRRLIRKCERESGGNVALQIDALHNAIDHGWQTVYFTDDLKRKYARSTGWVER